MSIEGPNDTYDATDLSSSLALSVAVVALEGSVVTSIAASVSGACCTVEYYVTAKKSYLAEMSGLVLATRLDKIGMSICNETMAECAAILSGEA